MRLIFHVYCIILLNLLESISLSQTKKTYFISDAHLGYDGHIPSVEREAILIRWLKEIKSDVESLYLVGDIFDYWFEYHSAVPKGYFRLLATLDDFVQSGIEVHYLKGNHDLWHFSYLQEQIGLKMYDGPITISVGNKKIYVAHGDGLGKGDLKYKLIKNILTNSICQRLFATIHPTIGLPIMKIMSSWSRASHDNNIDAIEANKIQIDHSESILKHDQHIDYFIMGHRHYPLTHILSNQKSRYINLGDWMSHFTYLVWDGSTFELKKYQQ